MMSEARFVQVVPGVSVCTDAPETHEEREYERRANAERKARKTAADARFREIMASVGAEVATVGDDVVATLSLTGGRVLTVKRAWAYLSASVEPALPARTTASLGYRVNHAPYASASPTKYSGSAEMLGSVCRAEGYAGGLFEGEFTSFCRRGLSGWHIDDVAALPALVAAINAG